MTIILVILANSDCINAPSFISSYGFTFVFFVCPFETNVWPAGNTYGKMMVGIVRLNVLILRSFSIGQEEQTK